MSTAIVILNADPPVSPAIINRSLITTNSRENGLIVVIEWESSDATMVDDYIIMISPPIASVSVLTTSNTSFQFFVLYNQECNVSVVANNCAGSSSPAETTLRIGKYMAN